MDFAGKFQFKWKTWRSFWAGKKTPHITKVSGIGRPNPLDFHYVSPKSTFLQLLGNLVRKIPVVLNPNANIEMTESILWKKQTVCMILKWYFNAYRSIARMLYRGEGIRRLLARRGSFFKGILVGLLAAASNNEWLSYVKIINRCSILV